MTIGIDARLFGPKHTGIGRYVQNLIDNLLVIDKKNSYVLFGDPDLLSVYDNQPRVKIVKLTPRAYSLAEQVVNPFIFKNEKLDLLHVPHFNAPLLYSGKLVITIHDLIKHLSTGKETTTLPAWQYQVKHATYKQVIATNIKKAESVITPTHYWKTELVDHYHVDPAKISVTYEGVDRRLAKSEVDQKTVLSRLEINQPFVVYTGNLYPHKNVETLVKAVDYFNQNHDHQLTLVLICGRSQFNDRVTQKPFVKYLGFVEDADMSAIYQSAICLVQPSFIEGFGLTGLEAMSVGTPVISSSATCLPEVYQDAALYFDPYSFTDLSDKIDQLIKDKPLRETLIKEGYQQVKLYSWHKTAQETLKVYEKVFGA